MKTRRETQEEYIGREVTLNGERAKIVRSSSDGHGGNFADVVSLESAMCIGFSWAAVYNVCDNYGGRFEAF